MQLSRVQSDPLIRLSEGPRPRETRCEEIRAVYYMFKEVRRRRREQQDFVPKVKGSRRNDNERNKRKKRGAWLF